MVISLPLPRPIGPNPSKERCRESRASHRRCQTRHRTGGSGPKVTHGQLAHRLRFGTGRSQKSSRSHLSTRHHALSRREAIPSQCPDHPSRNGWSDRAVHSTRRASHRPSVSSRSADRLPFFARHSEGHRVRHHISEGDRFRPLDPLPRYQAATILCRLAERYGAPRATRAISTWEDASEVDAEDLQQLEACVRMDLIEVRDHRLEPHRQLTRGEAAEAIYKILRFPWYEASLP